MSQQATVKTEFEVRGIGLHSGSPAAVRVLPATADHGFVFVRRDCDGAEIPASYRHLKSSSLATSLARGGVSVLTVEHLLAALHGLGIDNARIELEGPEVPILDGSAAPFVEAIQAVGRKTLRAPRRYLSLRQPITVRLGERTMLAVPSSDFRISYAIDFPHPSIGYQAVTVTMDEKIFATSIAPARTFCLLRDVQAMQASGLARGGSLDNALVVGEGGVLNDSLRFTDEFVRHKVLDLIGDLALLGRSLKAHVIAFKGGHQLHGALVSRIMRERTFWPADAAGRDLPRQVYERFAHLGERLVRHPQVLTA
ncbi:MAG TPA: UDP-3-O-acyl-N-acetylglucosamine deacetylase [Candidatus Cryosericum sp.]|nr:UDP-3-O-acyl-N-acetylglucosamine deacetylase [Candidatus Cryosericum sp.]